MIPRNEWCGPIEEIVRNSGDSAIAPYLRVSEMVLLGLLVLSSALLFGWLMFSSAVGDLSIVQLYQTPIVTDENPWRPEVNTRARSVSVLIAIFDDVMELY